MKDTFRENFPKGLSPFLESDSYEVFLEEMHQVPNFKEVFNNLIKTDPLWFKESKKYGAYFFVQEILYSRIEEYEPNMMKLCHFCRGTCPTIKVITFKKRRS